MGEKRWLDAVVGLSNFSVIDSQVTRARCRMMCTGRNRNLFDITEGALNRLIERKGYANVPVVAHLYKGDDGKWRVGGHDSRIVINSDGGIKIIDETIPFGVIPENCNPSFEEITEKSGEVKRYFCVDIILWTHRYNIMDAAKSDEVWFNQSMEIEIDRCYYDSDEYCVVEEFRLSALCLLNHDPYNKENEVEPCFPSASVVRFNLDDFRNEFNILYDKLKEFDIQKGEYKLDIAKIKSKLDGKFILMSATPDAAVVMAKENFELLEIPYAVNSEGSEIVFGYDKAAKKYMNISDKERGVSFAGVREYVDGLRNSVLAGAEKSFAEKLEKAKADAVREVSDKYSALFTEYTTLKAKYESCEKKIEEYRAAEKKAEADKHKAQIDEVIKKYESDLRFYPDFHTYAASVDYSKTAEQVENDLLVIVGKMALKKNNPRDGETRFALYGAEADRAETSRIAGGRYGSLFDSLVDE